MPAGYSHVEFEIERGRLWRAKEILLGRLAQSSYDPELFSRLAQVLEAMQDDDEAGRFHFLSGASSGTAGTLARRFLERRKALSLHELWRTMPKSARRRTAATVIPSGTVDHLIAMGKMLESTQLPIEIVASQTSSAKAPRPPVPPTSRAMKIWQSVKIWTLVGVFVLALLLGFRELALLLESGLARLFAA